MVGQYDRAVTTGFSMKEENGTFETSDNSSRKELHTGDDEFVPYIRRAMTKCLTYFELDNETRGVFFSFDLDCRLLTKRWGCRRLKSFADAINGCCQSSIHHYFSLCLYPTDVPFTVSCFHLSGSTVCVALALWEGCKPLFQ